VRAPSEIEMQSSKNHEHSIEWVSHDLILRNERRKGQDSKMLFRAFSSSHSGTRIYLERLGEVLGEAAELERAKRAVRVILPSLISTPSPMSYADNDDLTCIGLLSCLKTREDSCSMLASAR